MFNFLSTKITNKNKCSKSTHDRKKNEPEITLRFYLSILVCLFFVLKSTQSNGKRTKYDTVVYLARTTAGESIFKFKNCGKFHFTNQLKSNRSDSFCLFRFSCFCLLKHLFRRKEKQRRIARNFISFLHRIHEEHLNLFCL